MKSSFGEYTGLLICPKGCTTRAGSPKVLAGIMPDGALLIKRYGDGFTLVNGSSLSIYCDGCFEPVYYKQIPQGKEENGTILDYWSLGVYREGTFAGTSQ